jgi:acyl dehydratase
MAIDYDGLLSLAIPEVTQTYGAKDCILYALGVGLGHDPLNEDELAFVYEKSLRVLPTQACVLGYPGFWLRDLDTGVDWRKVVHGEQSLVLHRPLPPAGTVVGKTRVLDIVDKGAGKGAVILSERVLRDAADDVPIATVLQTTFCRGDGGFGGSTRPQAAPHAMPQRAPDRVCDMLTAPEAALIYRLSGDINPLHADPAVAREAGFPKPILHGLATFGVAGQALLRELCGYDPARLRAIQGRFSAPVFPGDTIRLEFWVDDVVSFRARVVARDVIAINNGRAEIV